MKRTLIMLLLVAVAIFSCGCSGAEESTASIASSPETNNALDFENALYSHLYEKSNVLHQDEFEISVHTSLGDSVYIAIKDYDGKAFAEAVTLSTDFIKENASSYGISQPELTVVSGADAGKSASWKSSDYETGFWVDTSSIDVGGKFPLSALQGTYIPGSTDDMVVYIESGGHMITYHSTPKCPELDNEIKMWEDYKKQNYSAFGVAKSTLSEKHQPCEICFRG